MIKVSDRMYRAFLGALLLGGLIFDWQWLMYLIIVTLLFEGITNWRIPIIAHKLFPGVFELKRCVADSHQVRIEFEAERAWRIMVAAILLPTYVFFYHLLWFVPWFLAFAILGAGVSGICPGAFSLKRIGFK